MAAIGVATVLSILTFVMVEQPFRSSNWLIKKPKRSTCDGGRAVCTCLMVALIVGSADAPPLLPKRTIHHARTSSGHFPVQP